MRQQLFKVEGMSCGHCEAAVREEVSKIPGITTISVSAKEGSLQVDDDGPSRRRTLSRLLTRRGMTPRW